MWNGARRANIGRFARRVARTRILSTGQTSNSVSAAMPATTICYRMIWTSPDQDRAGARFVFRSQQESVDWRQEIAAGAFQLYRPSAAVDPVARTARPRIGLPTRHRAERLYRYSRVQSVTAARKPKPEWKALPPAPFAAPVLPFRCARPCRRETPTGHPDADDRRGARREYALRHR